MRCERCGSRRINHERDALLVATALRIEGATLVLDAAPVPAPLDEVQLSCLDCGAEQEGLSWGLERPQYVPVESEPIRRVVDRDV